MAAGTRTGLSTMWDFCKCLCDAGQSLTSSPRGMCEAGPRGLRTGLLGLTPEAPFSVPSQAEWPHHLGAPPCCAQGQSNS